MVLQWSLDATKKCNDISLTDPHMCLERGKNGGDKAMWLITNDCQDAVFQFTLKDMEPVSNCKMTPPQPAFLNIESAFGIESGKNVVIRCVLNEKANAKKCEGDHKEKYVYAVELKQGGHRTQAGDSGGADKAFGAEFGKMRRISHELDIGVN